MLVTNYFWFSFQVLFGCISGPFEVSCDHMTGTGQSNGTRSGPCSGRRPLDSE